MTARVMVGAVLLLCICACATHAGPPQPQTSGAAVPSAAQLVSARQAGMHMAATLLFQGVKKHALAAANLADDMHYVDGLILWAEAIPGLFPPGSVAAGSRALPTIWQNKADFDDKARALQRAATRLGELAKANDRAAYVRQTDAVQASCNACHASYRSR